MPLEGVFGTRTFLPVVLAYDLEDEVRRGVDVGFLMGVEVDTDEANRALLLATWHPRRKVLAGLLSDILVYCAV